LNFGLFRNRLYANAVNAGKEPLVFIARDACSQDTEIRLRNFNGPFGPRVRRTTPTEEWNRAGKNRSQFGEIAIAENALSKLGANAELNPSNADACHLLAQIAQQTGQPSAIALDRERPPKAVPAKEQSFSEQRAGGWRRRVR
jgi:hypothetical protein